MLEINTKALYNNTLAVPMSPIITSNINGFLYSNNSLELSSLNIILNFISNQTFLILPGIYKAVSFSNTGIFYNKKVMVEVTVPNDQITPIHILLKIRKH